MSERVDRNSHLLLVLDREPALPEQRRDVGITAAKMTVGLGAMLLDMNRFTKLVVGKS